MWKGHRRYEDPFASPSPGFPPGVGYKWASRVARPARFWRPRSKSPRAMIFLLVVGSFILMREYVGSPRAQSATQDIVNSTTFPFVAFLPPEINTYREPDSVDTFESYKFRNACNISSLDLHTPFHPLCKSRDEMIKSMASGGRIGRDAPYMPRGCDMRWFTTEEVCEILGRFDRVVLVGDSMLRHVIGSVNVLVRGDIGYGAVTDWNFSLRERKECFCNEQFNVKACSVQGIYQTADVLKHDPQSLKCSNRINMIMEEIVSFPVPGEEISRLKQSAGSNSKMRKAFVFGHGLWSNLDLQKSLNWLDMVISTINSATGSDWHGLFITPNAAGKEKPDEWILSQGNKALMLFEESMGIEVAKRGLEHLGTWNMSIQANSFDGVHLDMKGNLVKAMMVMNWLSLLPIN